MEKTIKLTKEEKIKFIINAISNPTKTKYTNSNCVGEYIENVVSAEKLALFLYDYVTFDASKD